MVNVIVGEADGFVRDLQAGWFGLSGADVDVLSYSPGAVFDEVSLSCAELICGDVGGNVIMVNTRMVSFAYGDE